MRLVTAMIIGASVFALAACHKSSSTRASSSAGSNTIATAASNVVTATVSAGPGPNANINTLYTTVTICAPGSTTNCQTIDNIAVDTGASGLRVIASVLSPALAAALPLQVDGSGNNIVECTQYAIGYAWGPVATADMTISGESAASLPIQIIGSSQFPTAPAACAGTGVPQDTVPSFGANGTIGVSVFTQDCGSDCALTQDTSINPGLYWACSSPNSCSITTVPLAHQVPNPVTLFAIDNNGVIIELPAISATGSATVTGAIVFGVDTQTNNASGTATVLTVDPVHGYLSTAFNGVAFPQSFFDTGSNSLYFNDSALTPTLALCSDQANTGFYCPTSTASYSAAVQSTDNVLISVPFSVANTDTLRAGGTSLIAFNDLGEKFSVPGVFDWGIPFFFGRNVYNVIEGKTTTVATGPYVAF
ncbi:MAG: DUF3443 family protein [Steroidobacterales bacterium]